MDTSKRSQPSSTQNPLLLAFDRARRAADTYDRDEYQRAAEDIARALPNCTGHFVETTEAGFSVHLRLAFPNKKHRS